MTPKFFCYVDETGQDTRGNLFIVSVVVSTEEREQLRQVCESIERQTGKGRLKWVDAAPKRRLAYVQQVLARPIFRGCLNFAVFHGSRDYSTLTVRTIVRTLEGLDVTDYEATIWIDALPRALERDVGLRLRRSGIRAKKVRGVRRDESDALIRLADAICGFVRAATEGQPIMSELLHRAIQTQVLRDLSTK